MAEVQTEVLGISWNEVQRVVAPNRSGVYWSPLVRWWDHFGLAGTGYLIGDEYPELEALKRWFNLKYDNIENITGVSLENSDIDWDITNSAQILMKANWIICQAVLEHTKDPMRAVENLINKALIEDGLLYLHSHGPAFAEHRHPIDCYRFMRDGVLALAEKSNAKVEDILWTPNHWFMAVRRTF